MNNWIYISVDVIERHSTANEMNRNGDFFSCIFFFSESLLLIAIFSFSFRPTSSNSCETWSVNALIWERNTKPLPSPPLFTFYRIRQTTLLPLLRLQSNNEFSVEWDLISLFHRSIVPRSTIERQRTPRQINTFECESIYREILMNCLLLWSQSIFGTECDIEHIWMRARALTRLTRLTRQSYIRWIAWHTLCRRNMQSQNV